MLSFFRINDPYRLLILFLAILFIRLPYFISADPLLYELNWLTIGELLHTNDLVLYEDVLSPMAPLTAFVYTGFTWLFGKSTLALQIAALLLVAYQFSLFNNIMYKNKAYNENSYIPAFVYALLMQVFFDFFTLSPVLISLTFILLVLDNIYLRIENKLDDFTILKTGIFMGLAVLFYLPTILFFIATIISFALLTSLIFRRYMLFLYGFLLPIAAVCLYYLWNDALLDLLNQWFIYTFSFSSETTLNTWSLITIIALPVLIFVVSLSKTFTFSRFTNYQVRVQQVMFIMFLAAWACWLISHEKAPYQLVIFVPFLAFFISHFILLFKQKAKAEIFAFTFSVLIIGVNYYIFAEGSLIRPYTNYNKLYNHSSIYDPWVQNKKVLVIGDARTVYFAAASTTNRYYNWELSKAIWEQSEAPENLVDIYSNLVNDEPETIIDKEQLLPKVLAKLPTIADKYEQVSSEIYRLKKE